MKNNKGIMGALLTLITIVLLLPVQALAAGGIDLNRGARLTISYQDGSTSIVEAGFSIYQVATVNETGKLTTAPDFSQFNVNIGGQNDTAWNTLATTLEGYVLRDAVPPTDTGKTSNLGMLSFPNGAKKLTAGLYLVIGFRHTQNEYIYDAQPFMVMLPSLDKESNDWLYEVTVNPKYDKRHKPSGSDDTITRKVLKVWKDEGHTKDRPKEVVVQLLRNGRVYDTVTLNAGNQWRYTWTDLDDAYVWRVVEKQLEGYTVAVTREGVTFVVTNTYIEEPPEPDFPPPNPPPPPDPPGKPSLPQTGQLWWPVPALLAAGMLLLIVGLVRRRDDCR